MKNIGKRKTIKCKGFFGDNEQNLSIFISDDSINEENMENYATELMQNVSNSEGAKVSFLCPTYSETNKNYLDDKQEGLNVKITINLPFVLYLPENYLISFEDPEEGKIRFKKLWTKMHGNLII